jgi:hypothetical protein
MEWCLDVAALSELERDRRRLGTEMIELPVVLA